MDPDQKLIWLLDSGLIAAPWAWHEVYQVIASSFSSGSEEVKSRIWEEGWNLYLASLDEDDDHVREPRFLRLINTVDPDFAPAAKAMTEFIDQHPDRTFSPHPEFSHYMGDVQVIPPADLPPDVAAEHSYEAIRASELSDSTRFRHHELSEDVARKVAIAPEVGVDLLQGATSDGAWESLIWRAVASGLQRAQLDETGFEEFLEAVTQHPNPEVALDAIGSVAIAHLEHETTEVSSALAEAIAAKLLAAMEGFTTSGVDIGDPSDDLMFAALNTWPGKVARCFVTMAADRERKGEDPCSTPGLGTYVQHISELASSNWARVSWSALGRDMPYLLERCKKSIGGYLLHLASWEDEGMASATWQGLAYARWSRLTVDALYDHLPGAARSVANLPNRTAHGLYNTLAGIATTYGTDPTSDGGWLTPLITANDDEARADFAHAMRRSLDELSPVELEEIWDAWLGEWLNRRAVGFPTAVDSAEGSMLLSWIFPLQTQAEALGPILLTFPIGGQSWGFLSELDESMLPQSVPTIAATLVAKVVVSREHLFDIDVAVRILERAQVAGASEEAIESACEAIVGRGIPAPHLCQG